MPARSGRDRRRRPHLHPRRRHRRPGARRVTFMVEMTETANILHHATAAEPGDPRRDRPRHQHLRRPVARLGGRRAPARAPRRRDPVRHPLPRADRARRRAAAGGQPHHRGQGAGRADRLPAPHRAGGRRQVATASTWPGWPACRRRCSSAPARSWPTSSARNTTPRAGPRLAPRQRPRAARPAQLTLFAPPEQMVAGSCARWTSTGLRRLQR